MSRSTFIKSTVILSVATLVSKVLGSIFRIPLQNIAGDEVLGIFSLVYPVYMVALILSVAGIPIAISKLIAEARTKDHQGAIREIYISASILGLLFGVTSFLLIFAFSDQLAYMLGGPETELALVVVAATLLVAPYMAVYRGYFQGFENMTPTAVSQVIEQFVRVGIILVAAYVLVQQGASDEVIAGGVMSGSIIGAFISLVFLRWTYMRSDVKAVASGEGYSFATFKHWAKRILKVSIPIAIGTITMALVNVVDSFTVPLGLRTAGVETGDINYLYGIYGRGLALVQIATVFSMSVVLPLVPLITKKLAERQFDETRSVIERAFYMTHLVSWPAAAGLFALTLPMNLALFTDLEGNTVLAILNVSSVFTSIVVVSIGIMQGINWAGRAALVVLGSMVVKTVLNVVLIQQFGLDGAAMSTLVVYLILMTATFVFIYRAVPFKVMDLNVVKIMFSSIVMGALIGLPTLYMNIASWTRLEAMGYVVAAILVGAALYAVQIFVYKAIGRDLLAQFPVIGKFFK
ncbi:putative polysaccharide biosynthesis protein [Tenuibacillus multivorans]|uniref:Membrane protein involved in the export of O-antigen and teichoic acid n=1 Tax=Tenuibacillus multivorans TaxID=237069 RepID=A0A1G9X7P6_9BACI|nr:polysaccharide biosynthesis protein [Tenuibacillus multivorans]GEL78656.1 polysaccharide biosynthesis protein [Tenuibacillus multivorans]SDM92353.1 Membrane protein involved in the export of O-antigen and teichoic acid [Tenuibacillus multivorans]